ncbi:phage portal protein [Priestia flexa]|uniref:phage portal protein n=1 Tax=Priestia flexa TaxID=86664 RepID=UPI00240D7C72|nr:phage portal protein [Priestia flexa]WEZ10168.1 phage portal protein [Priestia flexa]
MNLQEYVGAYYEGEPNWYIDEVSKYQHQQRIHKVNNLKDYLNGDHKINYLPSYKYNGKEIEPKKIILQYAKTILNFQSSFLLKNPVSLTGDKKVVEAYQNVYKAGKFNRLNKKILEKVAKFGEVYEYLYLDGDDVKSYLIDPSEGYPIYNHEETLIGFIESYVHDAISYYTVYSNEYVEQYSNEGGEHHLVSRKINLSGLPVVYRNDNNELSNIEGRSDLEDYITILDNLEEVVSKFADSVHKFHNPIPVVIGQDLKGEGVNKNIAGGGIRLDLDGDFKFVTGNVDTEAFETVYKTLLQSLLDVSSTPAVSMNKTDISNLSEVSIKLLYSLAELKAGLNESFMRDGIEERHEKIRVLLSYVGVVFSDDVYESLDMVFHYAMPQNEGEIINNIKTLREIKGISQESMLEQSPYTSNVKQELKRLKGENDKEVKEDKSIVNNETEDVLEE